MPATFSPLLLLGCVLQAAPQTSAPSPAAAPSPPVAAEPDISLSITARAHQVRWRQVGEVSVRAWSEPSGAVVEENLTTGLPRPIPGQRTFHDVEWNLRGEATIAAPVVEAAGPPVQTPEGDPE